MEVAERLRASVAAAGQAVAGFGSISIGVALAKADSSPTSLLAEAREALLLAKHRGKNRVASRDGAGATDKTDPML
jgi:PleD family two-component response regulator